VPASGPVRALDRLQRRHPTLAIAVAVGRKFGDDEGGNLTALIAYRAFFSLFPLLLLLTSVLGFVLADDPDLRKDAVDSVLGQFPVVGEQIRVGTLEGSGAALVIGAVGSLWAGLGVVLATGEALDTIWDVPRGDRAGFLHSRLRSLAMLAVLGTLTVVSTVASGLVGGGSLGAAWGVAVSLALNLLVFGAVFHLLTSAPTPIRTIIPGTVAAAVGWAILQLVGGYFVSHQIEGATPAYGTFALVLGLLAWVHLGAMLVVVCAELNAVRAKRLWPRNLLR
jgi:YihY family inner membrane protein